jgi:hypothetical protein
MRYSVEMPTIVRATLKDALEKYNIKWDKFTDATRPGDDCERFQFWNGREKSAEIEVSYDKDMNVTWTGIHIYPITEQGGKNGNSKEEARTETK